MASSSVSQESLDIDDFEISTRQSRIRKARGALMPKSGDIYGDSTRRGDQNGDHGGEDTGIILEHESPSRSTAASRARDKRERARPNHLHKGKLPKDKRKLREKRRSTGVVSLPSTEPESTGDSLDDDDDIDSILETKRNTSCNEVIDADNPQTPAEGRMPKSFASRRSNKSPSDLEADLEDNQDYDSTVSHSETNLTLIGKSDNELNSHSLYSPQGHGRSFIASHHSPDTPKSFKPYFSPTTSENDAKTTSSTSTSSSSILSRYRWRDTEPVKQEQEKEPIARPAVSSIISRYDRKTSENENNSLPSYSTGGYKSYRERFNRDTTNTRGDNLGSHFHSNQRSYGSSYLSQHREDEEKITLQKNLEKEREENKKLRKLLEEKDQKIAELEKEVFELNKDLEDMDEENQKLQVENNALIRAVSQLSTSV